MSEEVTNIECLNEDRIRYLLKELEKELHSEIERIAFFDEVPQELTYPLIQPKLIDEAKRRGFIS